MTSGAEQMLEGGGVTPYQQVSLWEYETRTPLELANQQMIRMEGS